MKKILLSLMVLGVSCAFADSQQEAMSACMKNGGTQAKCAQMAKQGSMAKPVNDGGTAQKGVGSIATPNAKTN